MLHLAAPLTRAESSGSPTTSSQRRRGEKVSCSCHSCQERQADARKQERKDRRRRGEIQTRKNERHNGETKLANEDQRWKENAHQEPKQTTTKGGEREVQKGVREKFKKA